MKMNLVCIFLDINLILVLHQGEIVEEGTDQELLDKRLSFKWIYFKLESAPVLTKIKYKKEVLTKEIASRYLDAISCICLYAMPIYYCHFEESMLL